MKIALDPTPFHHDYELLELPATGSGTGLRAPAADPAPGLHPVLQPPPRRRRTGGQVPQGLRATPASASPRCCRCCGGRVPTRMPAKPRCATGSASSRSPSTSASTSSTPSSPAAPRRAEESERAFFRSMEELVPIFEREGIDVRIDPHPDDFVEDGLEAVRIIRGVNSPNIGMVYVACHTYHMGGNMTEIMRAAGDKLRLVHVADTMDHHRSHGLRYITNPPGNPARVHQHLKIGDGDVDWDEFFGGLAEIGFYDRPDTVMVSSVFAEDENAHEVSRYQLATMTDYVIQIPESENNYDQHHHPLDQQQGLPRHAAAPAPGDQPGHRRGHRRGRARQRRGCPRGDRCRRGGVPGVAGHLAGQAQRDPVQLPRVAQRSARASWPRSSPPSTARSSPTRSARSAAARRSSSSPAGSRICSRAGSPRTPRPRSTCTRSASRWARSASSARSTSRPWCRCGSSPSRSPTGNTVVLKPVGEGPVGVAVDRRAVGRGRAAAGGVQRAAGRQDRRR